MKNDIFLWLILALLPPFFYFRAYVRRRERERAEAAAKAVGPIDTVAVIAQFKKIRSIFARWSLLPLGLGIMVLMIHFGIEGGCGVPVGKMLGVPNYWWIAIGFGLFVFGLVTGIIVFRCPVCKAAPMDKDGGMLLNPEFCPLCKTRLRQRVSDRIRTPTIKRQRGV